MFGSQQIIIPTTVVRPAANGFFIRYMRYLKMLGAYCVDKNAFNSTTIIHKFSCSSFKSFLPVA